MIGIIIKDILTKLKKGKDNFNIYFINIVSKDKTHLIENFKFLSDNNIVYYNIQNDVTGNYCNNIESIVEKS